MPHPSTLQHLSNIREIHARSAIEIATAIDAWERDPSEDTECLSCGESFSVPPDLEATALCNPCAQTALAQLARKIVSERARLRSDGPLLTFQVPGVPRTKGSWSTIQTDKGVAFRNSAKGESSWSDTCGWYARQARQRDRWEMVTKVHAVEVDVDFVLPRPAKPANEYPIGDLDKLLRSALDAFTGILYTDDVQVARSMISKAFACRAGAHGPAREPGATFTVKLAPRDASVP